MYRPKNDKERILHRLKIAQGHLHKVMRMVEADEYCIDVLHQTNAVQQALRAADTAILEYHLTNCTADAFAQGQSDRAVKEVLSIIQRR
jgi:DNA-binding FrmR family transcriptional regulator